MFIRVNKIQILFRRSTERDFLILVEFYDRPQLLFGHSIGSAIIIRAFSSICWYFGRKMLMIILCFPLSLFLPHTCQSSEKIFQTKPNQTPQKIRDGNFWQVGSSERIRRTAALNWPSSTPSTGWIANAPFCPTRRSCTTSSTCRGTTAFARPKKVTQHINNKHYNHNNNPLGSALVPQ